MIFRQKIKPGDFVIGARKWKVGRAFDDPKMVIDVKDGKILVMVEEGTKWYNDADLERVVQIGH